jgi:hypothetical protein
MPSWKKVITSGSDASLASLFVANAVTSSIFSGSRYIGASFTGSFSGSVAAPGSNTNIIYNSSGVLAGSTNFIFDGTNVGIGTTSPSSHLDIRGTADTVGQISLQLRSGNTSANFNSNQITFGYANTALYRHAIKTRHNDGSAPGNAIDFYTWRAGVDTTSTIGTQHVMSLNGANVGIGTTAPQTGIRLDVSGAAAIAGGTEGIRLGNIGDNSNYDNVKIYYTGFNASAPRVYLTPRTTPGSGIINTYFHLLNTNGVSTTSNNTMGLLVDGSVGIGTTSPGYKLHISGGSEYIEGGFGTATATAYTSTNRLIFNNDYSDTARGPNKITLYDSVWLGGFGVHTDTLGYYSGANHRWYQASSATNAVHLMTLSTAGNLGIGTTNPGAKLSVVGSTDIIGATTISGSFSHTGVFSLQRRSGGSRQIVITSEGENAGNTSTANYLISIGPFSGLNLTGTGANSMIAIGVSAAYSITTGGSNSIYIGRNSGRGITTGASNIVICSGDQTDIRSNTENSIHILAGAGYELNNAGLTLGTLISKYAVIGGGYNAASYINDFYFGAGPFISTPASANLNFYAPSATGSTANLQGTNFTINAGRGTGTGTPGDFIIATSTTGSSGTTNQTLSNRVWIKGNSGNVGIGSSTPGATLDVNGNIRATSFTGSFSGSVAAAGSNTQVIYNNAGVLAGSNNFIFDGSNVGIGTTSPIDKLHVEGNSSTPGIYTTISNLYNGIGNRAGIKLINLYGGVAYSASIYADWTGQGLIFQAHRDLIASQGGFEFHSAAGVAQVVIRTNSGNVGIGTTAPTQKLEVQGVTQIGNDNVNVSSLIFARKNVFQARANYYIPSADSPTHTWIEGGIMTAENAGTSFAGLRPYYEVMLPAAGSKSFGFVNAASGSSFTSTALTSSLVMDYTGLIYMAHNGGNVGIGTTTPSAKLQVAFPANTTSYVFKSQAGDNLLALQTFTTTNRMQLLVGDYNGTSTPNIAAISDTNTGIQWAGSDVIRFVNNGSENVTINAVGSVGIGTTTPSQELTIYGGNANGQIRVGFADNANWEFGRDNSVTGDLVFKNNIGGNTFERLRITQASGNVGIGTTTPTGSLQVHGTLSISNNSVIGQGSSYGTTGAANFTTLKLYDSSTGDTVLNNQGYNIQLQTAGSSKFTILNNGNVGIGTSTPTAKLHVSSSTGGVFEIDGSGATTILYVTASGNVGIGTITPGATLDVIGNVRATSFTGSFSGSITSPGSNTQIIYNNAGVLAGSTNLVFNGSNVGIGTTGPLQLLHINGSILLDGITNGYTQAATRGIGYGSNNGAVSTDGFSGMDIQSVNAPAPNNQNYSQNLRFWTHHYGTGTGNTPRMVIQYNGNVGIGSVSPAYPLDVNGTVRVTTLIETSTKILKENIQPYSTDINKFKKLKPVSFNWKDTKKEDVGLIAEDLNKVFPEFVSKDDGKPVGIHYGKLAAIFINVIKEQQERIEALEKQVKKLIK